MTTRRNLLALAAGMVPLGAVASLAQTSAAPNGAPATPTTLGPAAKAANAEGSNTHMITPPNGQAPTTNAPQNGAAPRDAGSMLPVTGSPVDKSQVGYQSVPRNGEVCAQCVYFIFKPSQGGAPQSQCKMVAGNIDPAGWCEIWQPKTAT